jgi:transposase
MTEVIMSKKRYPDEFKVEAVKQVVDGGHSVADVAGRLGMTTHSLYAWIKKFGPDSAEHNAMSDEQAEIRRLKKELKRTRQERDLLKKAAVYFANQPE